MLLKTFNLAKRGKMKTFSDKAYDLLRKVPKGRVTTYKEIAHALGSRTYRGVGQAMKKTPMHQRSPDTGLLLHPVGLGDLRERHQGPL
jgi:hypothetical protein